MKCVCLAFFFVFACLASDLIADDPIDPGGFDMIDSDSFEGTRVVETYVDTVIPPDGSVTSHGVTVTGVGDSDALVTISDAFNKHHEPGLLIEVDGGNVSIDVAEIAKSMSSEMAAIESSPQCLDYDDDSYPIKYLCETVRAKLVDISLYIPLTFVRYDAVDGARIPNGIIIQESFIESFYRVYFVREKDVSRLASSCESWANCDREPTLLIHGYQKEPWRQILADNGGRDYWGRFPERLMSDGYDPYEFSWHSNARFQDVAIDLKQAIEIIKAGTGRNVHIVAHSFGGILTRRLLQDPSLNSVSSSIASVSTIGTPHSGIFKYENSNFDIDFPPGQDSPALFDGCGQITCHLMGENVFGSTISSLLDFDVIPGSEANYLTTYIAELPAVNIQSLIGFMLRAELPTMQVHSGDGLITGKGQRFHPDLVFTDSGEPSYGDYLTEALMGHAKVSEYVLGRTENGVDLDLAPYNVVEPADFVPYKHSTGTVILELILDFKFDEPYVKSEAEGFNDVYQRVVDWIALNPPAGVQENALIALYHSTNGYDWTDSTNWLLGDPCTDNWFGVTCDENLNIQQISLFNNNLVGTLPPELGNLADLLFLILGSNSLTGSIPVELGSLTKLQWLYMNSNQLTGSIPVALGNLTNLVNVGLDWNGLSTSDSTLDTFLDAKSGGDWSITQTIPPANVTIGSVTDQSVTLSWDAIEYTADTGRYRVWCYVTEGGPYSDCGTTPDKSTTSLDITGLAPATTYHFIIRSETDSHLNNSNDLVSDPSEEVSATTSGEVLTERDVLVALYNSTDGDNWTDNTNWLVGDPCTNSWYGITCDINSNIEVIFLYGNNLVGAIPPELGNLTNLKELWLSNNQLTGSIPIELSEMTNLQELILDDNQLTGSIPIELSELTNLQSLFLSSNELTGSIPIELSELINLQKLDLYDNQLTGSIPIELTHLNNLRFLFLGINQLTGSIPVELGDMPKLESLFLDNNQLTGGIPLELGYLDNLYILDLGNNPLTGSIPVELGDLTKLWWLRLYENQLTGGIPIELSDLTLLETLSLRGNQLTGSIPIELDNLINLSTLELSWNGLYTSDNGLDIFLDTKSGEDWSITQTVPPANVTISTVTDQSVTLSWDAIEYTADTGRYRVWCSTDQGGPYSDCGATANKSATSLEVSGLSSATTYYLLIRTETDSHADNQINLISDPGEEVSATTL